MENSKNALILTLPEDIRKMKIKEILNFRPNLKIEERKCIYILFRLGLTSEFINDDNTFVAFDLKIIDTKTKLVNDKENTKIEKSDIDKNTLLKLECDNSKITAETKKLDSSKKPNHIVKKFARSYRSPSPILLKNKICNKYNSKSKEKESTPKSSKIVFNLSKLNTPNRIRPWIPI